MSKYHLYFGKCCFPNFHLWGRYQFVWLFLRYIYSFYNFPLYGLWSHNLSSTTYFQLIIPYDSPCIVFINFLSTGLGEVCVIGFLEGCLWSLLFATWSDRIWVFDMGKYISILHSAISEDTSYWTDWTGKLWILRKFYNYGVRPLKFTK